MIKYTWSAFNRDINHLYKQVIHSGFKPAVVAGVSPNGMVPATVLANKFDVPLEPVVIDFNHNCFLSNGFLGEIALGYDCQRENILVVFDVVNTGKTLKWLKKDWQDSCLPNDPRWRLAWNQTVKFASIFSSDKMSDKIDFALHTLPTGKSLNLPWY